MIQAHLSPAHVISIMKPVKDFKPGQELSVLKFQRLLGLMSAASMGLLKMRPFQFWLKSRGFHPLNHDSQMMFFHDTCAESPHLSWYIN